MALVVVVVEEDVLLDAVRRDAEVEEDAVLGIEEDVEEAGAVVEEAVGEGVVVEEDAAVVVVDEEDSRAAPR